MRIYRVEWWDAGIQNVENISVDGDVQTLITQVFGNPDQRTAMLDIKSVELMVEANN